MLKLIIKIGLETTVIARAVGVGKSKPSFWIFASLVDSVGELSAVAEIEVIVLDSEVVEAAVVVFKAIDTSVKVVVIVVVESVAVYVVEVLVAIAVIIVVGASVVITAVVDSNKFTFKYFKDESFIPILCLQTNRIEFCLGCERLVGKRK